VIQQGTMVLANRRALQGSSKGDKILLGTTEVTKKGIHQDNTFHTPTTVPFTPASADSLILNTTNVIFTDNLPDDRNLSKTATAMASH
jgi:hypothetical protein